MELEVWRSRYACGELDGKPFKSYPATLIEVYRGKLNVKLRNGSYAKSISPCYARRSPVQKPELPSFVKVNADVEVLLTSSVETCLMTAKVLSFLGKEELVVMFYSDGSKRIVLKKDCRFISNMPNLAHYKEVDRLKNFKVAKETVSLMAIKSETDSNLTAEPDRTTEFDTNRKTELDANGTTESDTELENTHTSDPDTNRATTVSAPTTESLDNSTTSYPVSPLTKRDEKSDSEVLSDLASMMNDYNEKLTHLSSEIEMKLFQLTSEYRSLESKITDTLSARKCPQHDKDCSCKGGKNFDIVLTRWLSRNSSDSRSHCSDDGPMSTAGSSAGTSASPTPNHNAPTPPPPPTLLPSHHHPTLIPPGFVFQPHFGFLGGQPLQLSNFANPYARKQLGDKIYNVVSQKYGIEDAAKITDELLSVIV